MELFIRSALVKHLRSGRPRVLVERYSKRRCISISSSRDGNDKTSEKDRKVTPQTFQRAKRGVFFQSRPQLYNTFVEDVFLTQYLKRVMPQEVCEEVFPDLERFGERISNEIESLGRQAELEPPYIRKYNAWGELVDELVTCEAWRRLHCISAEEGLVAIAYERKHAQWSRLHQMAKTYLWGPSSGLYSCPLAMTDGAAMLIESSGVSEGLPALKQSFSRLTTRDPSYFWTSGQWMTERKGGSDVGQSTDTVAVQQGDGSYKLYGYKWFTSATDADMTFTLARVQDEQGLVSPASSGLSLFYLETKTSDGKYNNLELIRLKDKLGTRQLPTAELLLDGTCAHLVGNEGRGIAHITPMLTITRLHNSVISAGFMRRILQLSRDYATKRTVFGKYLADQPLHMHTLAKMEIETRGCTLLSLETARLVGLEEAGIATATDRHLLRLLNSINKLYTAKQAVAVVSEGLESFGGAGYLEDTGLPVLLRDTQVLTIWEGTTNVLSLDFLRVLQKFGAHEIFEVVMDTIRSRLSVLSLDRFEMTPEVVRLQQQMQNVMTFALNAAAEEPQCLEVAARDLALSLAHVYISMLLVEQACSDGAGLNDRIIAQRWCSRHLPLGPLTNYTKAHTTADMMMVMDGHGLSHTLSTKH